MEEDLWRHKSFVSNVNFEFFFGFVICAGVISYPLLNVRFVFSKLLCNVGTHVTKFFFYMLKNFINKICNIGKKSWKK